MSKPTQKTHSLYEKIAFLYPDASDAVYNKLKSILDDYAQRLAAKKGSRTVRTYSEKDAVLIAYADHVSEPGQKSLRTMHAFLRAYMKGRINRVHFLPFYPYSSDDGFAVIDYKKVKPAFGDWSDIDAIHQDFLLMFDFVANHVSASHPWFTAFLKGDEVYSRYFLVYDSAPDASKVYRPRTNPLFTKFTTNHGQKYVWTTFSPDQIDLNVNNPEVLLALVDTLLFYIEHGADTIRFDAVGYLWKDIHTESAHLPQTHMIIKLLRQIISELAPDVWFVVQANTRQEINVTYFGDGSDETHLIYNYSLPSLLLYTFIHEDTTKWTNWAQGLEYPPGHSATYLNITATHDGISLQPLKGILRDSEVDKMIAHVSKSGAKVNYRSTPDGGQEPYEINATYRSAIGSAEAFLASQAVQLAMRGVPGIYFNSIMGNENWLEGAEKLQNNRAINREKFAYAALESELHDTSDSKHAIYNGYMHLLDARKSEKLFSPAADQEVLMIDAKVIAIKRTQDGESLLAITNVSPHQVKLHGIAEILGKNRPVNILDGSQVDISQQVVLPPYKAMWLR